MPTDDLKQVVSEVAEVTSEEAKKEDENKEKLLVFALDDEEYAVNIAELQEIVPTTEITHVPNAPEFVKGIINLRGSIVVVVDLEKRFHLERKGDKKQNHIIVAEVAGNRFGISVDSVEEILKVAAKEIQETPDLVSSKINADYLKGVVVLKERLVILLDLQKLLQEKELLSLGDSLKETEKINTNTKKITKNS